MKKNLWITLCALLVLTGCEKGPVEASNASTGSGETTGTPAPTPPEAPKPSLQDLPASVKHEAFEYYGLASTKTYDMKLSGEKVAEQTGGVSVELEKIEGDQAFFKVARTGGIGESLGSDSVMVDAKGIYITGNTTGKLASDRYLILPAKLTPGTTWKLKNKITREGGQSIEEDSVYKVEGIRDLKTKSGTQKALLVSSLGDANMSSGDAPTKMKYSTKSWFVKGVGMVKSEISLTQAGQPPSTITIELVD